MKQVSDIFAVAPFKTVARRVLGNTSKTIPILAPFFLRSWLRSGGRGPTRGTFFPAWGLLPQSAAKSKEKAGPELDYRTSNFRPSLGCS